VQAKGLAHQDEREETMTKDKDYPKKDAPLSQSGLSDLLSCEGCKDNGPHDENCKLCFTCDGTGKLRANFTDKEGRYTFHKETCYKCKGTGKAR
jgi:DnaJ-class molecular chaperone